MHSIPTIPAARNSDVRLSLYMRPESPFWYVKWNRISEDAATSHQAVRSTGVNVAKHSFNKAAAAARSLYKEYTRSLV